MQAVVLFTLSFLFLLKRRVSWGCLYAGDRVPTGGGPEGIDAQREPSVRAGGGVTASGLILRTPGC